MHNELIYSRSIFNSNINNIELGELEQKGYKFLIIGGSSGYGKSIINFLKKNKLKVYSAGRSKLNDFKIDLSKKTSSKKIRKVCLKHKINIIIITSATSFLDHNYPDIFNKKYQKSFYLNSFYLYDLTREIQKHKVEIKAIIAFTSEAGWSGSPKSHINYNLSKTLLNSIIFHISESKLVNCICGLDPGEARTRMNYLSKENPNKCLPMLIQVIKFMLNSPKQISGSFFHVDGRHLSFLKKSPFLKALDL